MDDNLVRFQKWVVDGGRRREALAGNHPRMLEALLHAQRLPDVGRYAQIGFLRERGTAVNVVRAHAVDVLSTYKALLLNHASLESKNVRYNAAIKRFEDIALSHALLSAGLRALKLYRYSYLAANLKRGGCAGLRFDLRGDHRLGRDDVAESVEKTGPLSKDAEAEIETIVDWVWTWVDKESGEDGGGEFVEAARERDEAPGPDEPVDWAPASACGSIDLTTTTFLSELLPHQWRAVAFLRAAEERRDGVSAPFRGAVLADEPGLGKTVTTLALIALDRGGSSTIVVCPKSVARQWVDEAKKHLGDCDARHLASDADVVSSRRRRATHGLFACTYVFRAELPKTDRGDAAAATWRVHGDESRRRRRGYSVDTPAERRDDARLG